MFRAYQADLERDVYKGWEGGARNVLAVLPTGGGKTYVFSEIIRAHRGAACVIAHRQELVTQIATALARAGVRHRIIGPNSVIKLAVSLQMEEFGTSLYDPSAPVAVAGVDTLIRRTEALESWAAGVTLWVQDEAHHLLRTNKWGRAVTMFPRARGLGVTATPGRADGKGLGRHAGGVFDLLIEGPTGRELIEAGYLTDYKIFVPPSDLDLSSVNISSATGDYNSTRLRQAVHRSHIVGDVVSHYLRIAPGRLGVTFAVDVESATTISEKFNAAGVPSEVVHAKTPDAERVAIVRRFRRRDLLQLINVDIFGEGFDLPAIEVVSMARPTESYGLYAQQFGRGLRIMDGKEHAIIIDHVGNVLKHGLPDAPRLWTLDRRERRKSGNEGAIPLRVCSRCTGAYLRILGECPYCGHVPVPVDRSAPEFVDGDLTELDPYVLEQMRAIVANVDGDLDDYRKQLAGTRIPAIGQLAQVKRRREQQEAQVLLRGAIAWWAGYQRALGRSDSESYKRFYFTFGIDVLSAQALRAAYANNLRERVENDNARLGKKMGR